MYVDNVTITPSCKPITIVTLNPIADATIDQNDGDTSGTGTELLVGRDAGGNLDQALLQFDLSSIPPGSTVTNAKLRIYHAGKLGTGTYNCVVYRIIDSWTEATVGWPVGYDAGTQLTVLPVKIDATGDWEEWYIPPGLIHEWVDGVSPNSGVLVNFESTATNKIAKFSSRETANKPQLVISYTPP